MKSRQQARQHTFKPGNKIKHLGATYTIIGLPGQSCDEAGLMCGHLIIGTTPVSDLDRITYEELVTILPDEM